MKKMRVFTVLAALMLLTLFNDVGVAADRTSGLFARYSYDPAFVYPGKYPSDKLYYHYPGNPNWHVGFSKNLSAVTCRAAYNSFARTGTWKGHLQQDGSCADPSEPADWAVGNRLNFDASGKP